MLQLRYKKLRFDEDMKLPTRRKEDADYDLYASVGTLVPAHETRPITTNIALEFPDGWEGKIEGKSGLALRGISVLGGVIDNSYTGEIIVIITNLGKKDFLFERGHKVAQLKLRQVSPWLEFVEVQDLKNTVRGDKGFGSQGK